MNQYLKLAGLFTILPLVMVSLSPNLIGDVEATKADGSPGTVSPKAYGSATAATVCGDRLCGEVQSTVTYTTEVTHEEMPDFMPTIETVQVSNFSGESDFTFNAIYEITAGDKNIENVIILVESDIESMMISAGNIFATDNTVNVVKIKAMDPMTIMAKIVGFQLND